MKTNNIELATEFDSTGNPTRYETFVTRPTIKLSLVYECVSFLSSLKTNPNENELHQMMDLVVRIYDEQMSKSQLIDGLPSNIAVLELYEQIMFVASGKNVDEELADKAKTTTVSSWADYKENLRATIQDMSKQEGQSVQAVLDLPFFFVFDELNKEAKKKEKTTSMFEAFGVNS